MSHQVVFASARNSTSGRHLVSSALSLLCLVIVFDISLFGLIIVNIMFQQRKLTINVPEP